jgi:hypothetical protein
VPGPLESVDEAQERLHAVRHQLELGTAVRRATHLTLRETYDESRSGRTQVDLLRLDCMHVPKSIRPPATIIMYGKPRLHTAAKAKAGWVHRPIVPPHPTWLSGPFFLLRKTRHADGNSDTYA